MTEMEENGLPWCLRGYPFKCSLEEAIQLADLDDKDLLLTQDEICRNCRKRFEYEEHHRDFTV